MALKGVFAPPGDKSISHRLALMSLLASGECRAENFSVCADVRSSLESAMILGVDAGWRGRELVLTGAAGRLKEGALIDCGNSGTTMRLLMGILAGRSGEFLLDGDESLRKRPMERVASPLRLMGAQIESHAGRCPVLVKGNRLQGIEWELPVASAQLKSAVLLAGIQALGSTSVRELVPSRDHTERLLASMGARISGSDCTWTVEQSTLQLPAFFFVPGDASSGAFFLCAAAIIPGSEVTADRMLLNPTRTGFIDVLRRMGADIKVEFHNQAPEPWGTVQVRYSPGLTACTIGRGEIPALVDEVPILALVATQARGTSVFEGVGELRVKESDRLAAVASQLGRMAAKISVEGDCLTVEGPTRLASAAELDSFGDHRIAMTLRLAGVIAGCQPEIKGEESVGVSYPGFHEALGALLA